MGWSGGDRRPLTTLSGYRKWKLIQAMKLRTTAKNAGGISRLKSPGQAPEVYFKATEATKKKHSTSDLECWTNPSGLVHLIMHRPSHPSPSILRFEGSLRSASAIDQRLLEKERGWSSLPKIDRNEQPTILKQSSFKQKVKGIGNEDFESAYDGYRQYPQYPRDPIERNVNSVRHLLRG